MFRSNTHRETKKQCVTEILSSFWRVNSYSTEHQQTTEFVSYLPHESGHSADKVLAQDELCQRDQQRTH